VTDRGALPFWPGSVADLLRQTWERAVGSEPARMDADLFAAGGDSLTIARMVSRLRDHGIEVSPADFLLGRTFDGILARLNGTTAAQADGSPGEPGRAGAVPLLPAQFRWLENGFADPDHFALSWTFKVPPRTPDGWPVGVGQIDSALSELVRRNEALRTRYLLDGPAAEVLAEPPAGVLRTVMLPKSASAVEVAAALGSCHLEHELVAGRVLAGVWLPAQRLLHVAVHHLTLDGYSLSMLADQLEDLLLGRPHTRLAAQPRTYASALAEWCRSDSAATDESGWAELDWSAVRRVPIEMTGAGLLASMEAEIVALDAGQTAAAQDAAARLGCSTESLLFAAVGTAVAESFGLPAVSIDAYHHGRDGVFSGPDLTGTIAYIQSTYPVIIPAGPMGCAVAQIRRVPAARFGFDALRFGASKPLAGLPSSGIRLNFRGRMNEMNSLPRNWLRPAEMSIGGRRSGRQAEIYRLLMEGDLSAGRLVLTVAYSTDHFHPGTIRALAGHIMARLSQEDR
jgi:Condensation domain/Phosphopantetheine attachment site